MYAPSEGPSDMCTVHTEHGYRLTMQAAKMYAWNILSLDKFNVCWLTGFKQSVQPSEI